MVPPRRPPGGPVDAISPSSPASEGLLFLFRGYFSATCEKVVVHFLFRCRRLWAPISSEINLLFEKTNLSIALSEDEVNPCEFL